MRREEAIRILKSYAQYSYGIWHNGEEEVKAFDMAIEALSAERTGEWVQPVTLTEPKPVLTEEVRGALMRLTMCAREECSICKYENDCGFDKQVEMATKSMNTILKAFKEPPTWIRKGGSFQCPVCGEIWNFFNDTRKNYCPNCGAKMGGDME